MGITDGPAGRGFAYGYGVFADKAGSYKKSDGSTITYQPGDFVRTDEMGLPLFAYGGDYRITVPGTRISVPVGNLLDLPVGALWIDPRKQEPFLASMSAAGMNQSYSVFSRVNQGGFDAMFRDEQAVEGDGQASSTWIVARTHLQNALNVYSDSMINFNKNPNAQDALRAQVALRDIRMNALVTQNDALRIPLEKDAQALNESIASRGYPIALASINDAHIHASLNGMAKKYRVNCFPYPIISAE